MDDAGQKLKQARERLSLKFRDVQDASQKIAEKYGNDDYSISVSRLFDIENKKLIPTIYKLYSICAIYRLDFEEVLSWYGIQLSAMIADGRFVPIPKTHPVRTRPGQLGNVLFPLNLDPGFDPRHTSYLTRLIQRWGKVPLLLLDCIDPSLNHRYAFIGTEDWFMYPLLQPGTFIMLDESRRKIAASGWTTEFERPIYFFEHRSGYFCSWCVREKERFILIPHPASGCTPLTFAMDEVDILGQVIGLATRLDLARRRRSRSAED